MHGLNTFHTIAASGRFLAVKHKQQLNNSKTTYNKGGTKSPPLLDYRLPSVQSPRDNTGILRVGQFRTVETVFDRLDIGFDIKSIDL